MRTSLELSGSSKQGSKICSIFFNNQIVQIQILDTSLSLTKNKIQDSSNIKSFLDFLSNEKLNFSPISIFYTEKYRLEKTKELETLALGSINDFQFSKKENNDKRAEFINTFKYNTSFLNSLYSSIAHTKNSSQLNLNKLFFEPIDSLAESVPDRLKKYDCEEKLVTNCSYIFKSIREARENKTLLKSFCIKGDVLSCELLGIEKK